MSKKNKNPGFTARFDERRNRDFFEISIAFYGELWHANINMYEMKGKDMNPVKVRNVEIGTGMPKICVPIVGRTKEAVLEAAVEAEPPQAVRATASARTAEAAQILFSFMKNVLLDF